MTVAIKAKLNEKDCIESSLKKYGYGSLSFVSLYPGIRFFSVPGIEGFIPYIRNNDLTLGACEPVCDPENIYLLAKIFLELSLKETEYVGFIPVSERTQPILKAIGFDSISIGKEPIFDLKNLKKQDGKVRNSISRAIKKGLKVVPFNSIYEKDISTYSRRWERTREMPAMQFLFELNPLELKEYKKYFLLIDDENRLKAFLSCSPIYERNGWNLHDLVREENAPHGCSELLITSALNLLAEEGYSMASYGLAPLSKLPSSDINHPIVNKVLRYSYEKLSFIYHFQSLEYFKDKFEPNYWEENSFCFYPKKVKLKLAYDLLKSFLPGGLSSIIKYKATHC
jgi:lysylphosphatidylglycerol synthetase-like protein (DUF2156 family)